MRHFPSQMSRNEEKNPKPRPSRGYVSGAGGEGVEAPAAPRVGTVPVPGPARAGPGWALRDAGARRPLSLPPPEPPRAGGRQVRAGGPAPLPGSGGRGRTETAASTTLLPPSADVAAGGRRDAAPSWARKRRRQVVPPRPGRGHERGRGRGGGGGTVNRPPAAREAPVR